jgi:hypothetical protein
MFPDDSSAPATQPHLATLQQQQSVTWSFWQVPPKFLALRMGKYHNVLSFFDGKSS